MLWLKTECQGDIKKYEGEYLKKDGEYFVVGKKGGCEIDGHYPKKCVSYNNGV